MHSKMLIVVSLCAAFAFAHCDQAKSPQGLDPSRVAMDLGMSGNLSEDMAVIPSDMTIQPRDLAVTPPDMTVPPRDLATLPPDMKVLKVRGTFDIDYGGGMHVHYTDIYYADAYYYPAPNASLVRIQQNSGYSIWAIYIGAGVAVGPVQVGENIERGKLQLTLAENSGALPAALRGGWQHSMGSGTITVSDLRNGGSIEGSAAGSLTHIITGAKASFSVSFAAILM